MKKYIFLTFSITGLSGNPRYVNNKCRWLKQQGWDVMVFWHNDVKKVQLEHVLPFSGKEYIIHELGYYPSWFTKCKRKGVIKKIVKQVGFADQIVIESNTLPLGAWGELLAEKLKAKHINFVTTEKTQIQKKNTFDFCYAKLKRNEFFTISEAAVNQLFSKFVSLTNPKDYYWDATMGVEVEEIPFPVFDNMPHADYVITHFGRTKGYFPYMIGELKQFVTKYPDKKFNLFFLGQVNNPESIEKEMGFPNVNIVFHPEVSIVPIQIFSKSDVVIGAAGCAWLSSNNGGKTISMDVNNNQPLGLLQYTTLDSNTWSGNYENNKSLFEWLQTLLIDETKFERMELSNELPDYDYQMQFVTQPDGNYFDSTKMIEEKTAHDKLWIAMSRMGLFKLVDWLFYAKRKDKRD